MTPARTDEPNDKIGRQYREAIDRQCVLLRASIIQDMHLCRKEPSYMHTYILHKVIPHVIGRILLQSSRRLQVAVRSNVAIDVFFMSTTHCVLNSRHQQHNTLIDTRTKDARGRRDAIHDRRTYRHTDKRIKKKKSTLPKTHMGGNRCFRPFFKKQFNEFFAPFIRREVERCVASVLIVLQSSV
jgi:hypothetical protein